MPRSARNILLLLITSSCASKSEPLTTAQVATASEIEAFRELGIDAPATERGEERKTAPLDLSRIAEAFAEAKRRDAPVLLSVGYAACHWCHVMAHESFEDEATARLLNEHFVSIKVDREERPDIDAVYMEATLPERRGSIQRIPVLLKPREPQSL